MRTLLLLPLILITAALSSCQDDNKPNKKLTHKESPMEFTSKRLSSTVSSDLFQVLKESRSAVCYPVKHDKSSPNGEYTALDKPTQLPEKTKKAIKGLLMNDSTYQFVLKKKCPFIPHIAVEFKHHDQTVVALIGFSCKKVRFIFGEEKHTIDIDPGFEELEKALNILRRK